MEFKHVRGSILILFDKITQIPLLAVVILLGFLLSEDFDPQIYATLLFLALSPLFGIAKYLSTYYTVEADRLIVESGIFRKKRMDIPLSRITTVDLSQNILYQLFKTYKIKVDNGSQAGTAADQAEVLLALKAEKAMEFKGLITQNSESQLPQDKNTDEITASPLDFI